MPNQTKIDKVAQVVEELQAAKSAALLQYQGLTAEEIAKLRRDIKQKGGRMEVIKNSLITRALAKIGISLPEPLVGPTSIAYSLEDEIAPFKEIDQVNKEKEVTQFKYGIFDQNYFLLKILKKSSLCPPSLPLLPILSAVSTIRFNAWLMLFVLTKASWFLPSRPWPTNKLINH
jgi:large subunit ribosomal protein L10